MILLFYNLQRPPGQSDATSVRTAHCFAKLAYKPTLGQSSVVVSASGFCCWIVGQTWVQTKLGPTVVLLVQETLFMLFSTGWSCDTVVMFIDDVELISIYQNSSSKN